MLNELYSKQEAIKTSESIDTPYKQISDRQQKLLIDLLAI